MFQALTLITLQWTLYEKKHTWKHNLLSLELSDWSDEKSDYLK